MRKGEFSQLFALASREQRQVPGLLEIFVTKGPCSEHGGIIDRGNEKELSGNGLSGNGLSRLAMKTTARALFLSMAIALTLPLPSVCNSSEKQMDKFLKLGYWDFDQTPKGWRSITDKPDVDKGDFLSAAKLLDLYYKHRQDLKQSQLAIVAFHAGQNYAFAGFYDDAIVRFKQSFQKQEPDWNAYVHATIAFLKRDKTELLVQRKKLASPPGQMNLNVVDRLIENFDETYSNAYSSTGKTKSDNK